MTDNRFAKEWQGVAGRFDEAEQAKKAAADQADEFFRKWSVVSAREIIPLLEEAQEGSVGSPYDVEVMGGQGSPSLSLRATLSAGRVQEVELEFLANSRSNLVHVSLRERPRGTRNYLDERKEVGEISEAYVHQWISRFIGALRPPAG